MTPGPPCDHEQGRKIATFAILRAMPRTLSTVRALALVLLTATTSAAVTPAGRWNCGPLPETAPSPVEGRVLILPGVGNTRFHLAGFVAATEATVAAVRCRGPHLGQAVPHDSQLARARAQRRDRAEHRRGDRRLAPRASGRAVLPRRLFRRRRHGDAGDVGAARRRQHRSPRARRARDLARLPGRERGVAARARVRRQLRERARSASRVGHAHVRHHRPQEHHERRRDRLRGRTRASAAISLVGGRCAVRSCRQSLGLSQRSLASSEVRCRRSILRADPRLCGASGRTPARSPDNDHGHVWRCSAVSSAARCSATSVAS